MRDAGKVAMTPKGVYNEETTYEYLDVVLFGTASWVAKKVTTGNPPEDGEYWQKLAAGAEEIINDNSATGINTWSAFKISNLYKEQPLTFTEASSRENISTGDTQQTVLSKVKKWFNDLKTVAFTGNYNDLSYKPTLGNAASKAVANNVTTTGEGSVLDARQGKILEDEINKLNSDIHSIKDINKTNLVLSENTHYMIEQEYTWYMVRNGICYFQFSIRAIDAMSGSTSYYPFTNNFPKPDNDKYLYFASRSGLLVRVNGNGNIRISGGTNGSAFETIDGAFPVVS